ncbi:hypothetical protein B0H11DRAFT_2272372 [Mycena galericulata]|nr:hypothetical protein B0H11DRAFT_2272372 [Mycena galericulata]
MIPLVQLAFLPLVFATVQGQKVGLTKRPPATKSRESDALKTGVATGGKVYTVPLTFTDGLYTTQMSLGTPPQTFKVLLDTGCIPLPMIAVSATAMSARLCCVLRYARASSDGSGWIGALFLRKYYSVYAQAK